MREQIEIRVREDLAHLVFRPDEGEKLGEGGPRVVSMSLSDPRFVLVCRVYRELKNRTGEFFYSGWQITRLYTKLELSSAEAFHLVRVRMFQPSGEECGTTHDPASGCPDCRAGQVQTSALKLDPRRFPKNVDIAKTIGGEIVVSQRFAELLLENDITGYDLGPVVTSPQFRSDSIDFSTLESGRDILRRAAAAGHPRSSFGFYVWLNRLENRHLADLAWTEYAKRAMISHERRRSVVPGWYQLFPRKHVRISEPTVVGIKPCDADERGEYRCRQGDTIGLNLLSELSISRADYFDGPADIVGTKEYIGCRQGVLRPERCVVISRRVWEIMIANRIRGAHFEVANIV
jgi:hypothetical protein